MTRGAQAQVRPAVPDGLGQALHSAHAVGKQAVHAVREHARAVVLAQYRVRYVVIPVREKDGESIALRLEEALDVGVPRSK